MIGSGRLPTSVFRLPISLIFICLLGLLQPLSSQSIEYLFFSPAMISTHLETYNAIEREWIAQDLNVVKSVYFHNAEAPNASRAPLYIATAGGPGARKTTILERFLKAHPEWAHFVYLDPDHRALKFMVHTYYSRSLTAYHIGENDYYISVLQQAYEKWRPASNFITLTLLEEAFRQRFDIVHGTTFTGAHTPAYLQALKKAGYRIVLLLCSCEDEVRREAIHYRDEILKFYQSTPEDAVVKGKLFALRMPHYFAYADEIHLFWSDAIFARERLAATYESGLLSVKDADALEHFIDKYNRDRLAWQNEGVSLPGWDEIFTISH